jgi:hypothetical protein
MVAAMCSKLVGTIAGVVLLTVLGTVPAYASKSAYFGAAVEMAPGQNSYDALVSLEAKVGRHLHILRLYRSLNDTTFSGAGPEAMKARGLPMYLNVSSAISNRCVSWGAVAAGKYNRYLKAIARSVKRYRYRVYFSWNHEMQGNCHTGTAADYRASYKRVRRAFRRHGVTNAIWVWTVAAGNLNHDAAKAAKYLPKHVDLIGVDGYNRAGDWRSVKEIFGAAHRFAAKRGLHLFVGEIGCAEDPSDSTAKGRWIANAYDTFKAWNVAAVVWSNVTRSEGDYKVDTSSAALTAYQQAGDMSFYGR